MGKKIQEIAVLRTINTFLAFYAEIQDGHQKWRENNFWVKVASTLCR